MVNRVYNVFGTIYCIDPAGFLYVFMPNQKQWLYQGEAEDHTFVTTAGVLVGLNWRHK